MTQPDPSANGAADNPEPPKRKTAICYGPVAMWWAKRQWWLGGKGPREAEKPLARREFVKALR